MNVWNSASPFLQIYVYYRALHVPSCEDLSTPSNIPESPSKVICEYWSVSSDSFKVFCLSVPKWPTWGGLFLCIHFTLARCRKDAPVWMQVAPYPPRNHTFSAPALPKLSPPVCGNVALQPFNKDPLQTSNSYTSKAVSGKVRVLFTLVVCRTSRTRAFPV